MSSELGLAAAQAGEQPTHARCVSPLPTHLCCHLCCVHAGSTSTGGDAVPSSWRQRGAKLQEPSEAALSRADTPQRTLDPVASALQELFAAVNTPVQSTADMKRDAQTTNAAVLTENKPQLSGSAKLEMASVKRDVMAMKAQIATLNQNMASLLASAETKADWRSRAGTRAPHNASSAWKASSGQEVNVPALCGACLVGAWALRYLMVKIPQIPRASTYPRPHHRYY